MKKQTIRSTVLVGLVAAALLLTTNAYAQEPTPSDNDVNAVAKQLYCPVCENVPLDVCPTVACAQWRELIREKLSAGWSEQQIKDYFVTQYGDRVLAEPPRHGLNWLVYVLPPVAILAGALILAQMLRGMRRPAVPQNAPPPPAQPPSDDYTKKLEEELRQRQ